MKPSYAQPLLHQALLELLQKKPLNKITVSELCKKAGVNRTTFYHYYTAPVEILYEVVEQFSARLSFSETAAAIDTITQFLTLMETNLKLSRLLLQALPGTYLSDRVLSLPPIDTLFAQELTSSGQLSSKASVQAFISAGSSRLISDWILRDDRCSAREEAELILSICKKFCH